MTLNELMSMEPGSVVDLLCVVGGFGFGNACGPESFWIWGGGRDWMDRCDEVFGRVHLTGSAPWVTKLLELSNADIFDDWPLDPDKVVMVRNASLVCFDDGPKLLAHAADVDTAPQHPWAATLESWVHAKQSDRESILATHIQACWRGAVGRAHAKQKLDFEAIELEAKLSWRPSLTPLTEEGASSPVATASFSAAMSSPSFPRDLALLSAAEFESIMQLKKLQAKAASKAEDARTAECDFEAIEMEAHETARDLRKVCC